MNKRYLSAFLLLTVFFAGCNRDPNAAKKKYVENGNKYFEKGKHKEALIMYKNALKKDMRYGEAYYRSALAELQLARYADAARDLQRAIELQPENQDAHVRLGNLFLNVYLGDPKHPKDLLQEIRSVSERTSKHFPDSYDDARLKGYIALFDNDLPSALTHFAKANELKPMQQDVVLVYMQTLSASGKPEEAEQLAYAALKKDPSALAVYDALFVNYMREKKVADAERILKSKVEHNPKAVDARLQLAAHYLTTQQKPEMLATLNAITADTTQFPTGRIRVGDFFLRTREYDLALQNYQEGLKSDPKQKSVYQKRIVEVYVKQNKRDEAFQLIKDVLKADEKDPEAIAMKASLTMLSGSPEELQSAINDLQSVVARMPTNPVIRYNLGRALLAKGNPDAARVQFEEAVKLRPDYLHPRLELGRLYLQNRDFSRVVQTAQEILNYDPQNLHARLLRSRALAEMGDVRQAREELQSTAKTYPAVPETRMQMAALDLKDRNFKGAEDTFRQLYSSSQDPRAFVGLVETLVAGGQLQAATKLLEDEVAKFPDRIEYQVALANVSTRSGDFNRAITEYKKAIAKKPEAAELYLRLGEAYRRSGDAAQASANFKKAGTIAPSNVTAHMQLALLYEGTGQRNDARPLYEQVLRLQPDNPVALNNLAYMLAENGADLDQALTMAQKAKQQAPNDLNVSDTLGWIYIKKNLSDSAIGIFRDLVEKQPEHSTYRYHLAMALFQKGDRISAKKELETALRNKPSRDEEAKIRDLMAKLG
jgi:tetratricopeptide (TPR) repeat protein